MSATSSPSPEPGETPASAADRQRRRRLRLVLIVAGGAVGLAAIALLVRVLVPVTDASPASTTAATPTSAPTESSAMASAAPTSTSDDGATAVPQPTDCAELYSPAMLADFGGLELNPAWTQEPGVEVTAGSDDAELQTIIDAQEHLRCVWASPVGGSGTGLTTDVVWVSAAVSATVENRLEELGMECYPETGGLRCVTVTTSEDGVFGESHFLRDGIWLATKFTNFNPAGYTPALVAALWPEG